jgi:hypothetical protein
MAGGDEEMSWIGDHNHYGKGHGAGMGWKEKEK